MLYLRDERWSGRLPGDVTRWVICHFGGNVFDLVATTAVVVDGQIVTPTDNLLSVLLKSLIINETEHFTAVENSSFDMRQSVRAGCMWGSAG